MTRTLPILHVLLIDNNEQTSFVLRRMLAGMSITLDESTTLAGGLSALDRQEYDAVLLSLGLPDMHGVGTFFAVHDHCKTLPVVILAAREDQKAAFQAIQMGAQDYLVKEAIFRDDDGGGEELRRSIVNAIERQKNLLQLQSTFLNLEQKVVARSGDLQRTKLSLASEFSMRKRYEIIANASKDWLCLVDREYRHQAANDAYCLSRDLSRKQILGTTLAEVWGKTLFAREFRPYLNAAFRSAQATSSAWSDVTADGTRYYEINCYPLSDDEGIITHVVVDIRDETTREVARSEINSLNERLRIFHEVDYALARSETPEAVFRTSMEYLSILIPFDRIDLVLLSDESQPPVLFSGSPGEKIQSRSLPAFSYASLPPELIDYGYPVVFSNLREKAFPKSLLRLLVGKGMHTSMITPVSAEGKFIGLLALSSAEGGSFTAEHVESLRAVIIQFALALRNALLIIELRKANEMLQHLASCLISAQEEERRRISLELHDESGQYLTALKLNLAQVLKRIPQESTAARQQCQSAIELTVLTHDRIHSLARTLRPPALDMMDLNSSIKDLCYLATGQSGIQVEYSGSETAGLPNYIQTTLFRLAQEGLTNIVKHSHAACAKITLENEPGFVEIKIEDDGCGFVPWSKNADQQQGIGLIGMKERLDAVGGTLSIQSDRTHGTQLLARIPIKEVL